MAVEFTNLKVDGNKLTFTCTITFEESTPTALDRGVEILKPSSRLRRAFRQLEIKTLKDLLRYSPRDIRRIKGVGAGTLGELECKLESLGLELNGRRR